MEFLTPPAFEPYSHIIHPQILKNCRFSPGCGGLGGLTRQHIQLDNLRQSRSHVELLLHLSLFGILGPMEGGEIVTAFGAGTPISLTAYAGRCDGCRPVIAPDGSTQAVELWC